MPTLCMLTTRSLFMVASCIVWQHCSRVVPLRKAVSYVHSPHLYPGPCAFLQMSTVDGQHAGV